MRIQFAHECSCLTALICAVSLKRLILMSYSFTQTRGTAGTQERVLTANKLSSFSLVLVFLKKTFFKSESLLIANIQNDHKHHERYAF